MAYDPLNPGAKLGDPNAPAPKRVPPLHQGEMPVDGKGQAPPYIAEEKGQAPPLTPEPAPAPAAPVPSGYGDTYDKMKARQDAMAAGQPDPGAGYGQPAAPAAGAPAAGAPAAPTQDDIYRDMLMKRAEQSTDVDTNDPTFRKVADTYAASEERARRNATDMAGESMAANGMGSSGLMDAETRLQTERSSQNSANFESQLALSELANKRAEIQSALDSMGSNFSGDKARALTDKLAQLDATIKRESLAQTGALGQADISLRDRLGTQGNNLSAMDLLMRNQQQNNRLGFDIGSMNASLNNDALRSLF
jgi:hypothetical protein